MTDKIIRVGIIGLGVMGQRMLTNMQGHASFEVTAAWDPLAEACTAAQGAAPGLNIVASAAELIASDITDLIYIACPPHWHREYADLAMDAGKPVYCEKPLGIDLADSEAFVARLEETGTKNIVNFAQSQCRAVAEIERAIKSGEIGSISGLDAIVHFSNWPRDWQADADWLRYRDQGGYTREVFSHFIYVIERLMGRAELISSTPVYQDDPALCETHISAVLDCSHNDASVPITLMGSSGGVGPDRVELTLWGDKKSYRLHDWFNLQISDGDEWQSQFTDVPDLRVDSFARQLDGVAVWMRGENNSLASAQDALSVQRLIEEMLQG
ncbi:MAG: Gfo/Idh/MocA family oxidoreductase [Alphaproteobacteria bacterium]|jgi:predicted dehydrogenase|nr:Gfo/Idh/MocA family oxidoreductase [Alphaproteobacteria bacterium]MBT4967271.1 Gfo/Idh/MocA family oxidoreductase [Alphaproteobacteria bacterium]MBT5160486.1 Gfo/Idh/MocA family oxidoreductase [Alphaproteobacteria bacterium]MBT5917440.1 Gfo/Idh/MocA family oxidoreductase [Alphaproteobacteria bacterium]